MKVHLVGMILLLFGELSLKEGEVMFSFIRIGQLLAHYDRLAHSLRMRLLDRYHAKLVWGLLSDARLELARLNPKYPTLAKDMSGSSTRKRV